MFSVHIAPEEYKNATNAGQFGFVFEENHVITVTSSFFEKLRFHNAFRLQFRYEERFRKAPTG